MMWSEFLKEGSLGQKHPEYINESLLFTRCNLCIFKHSSGKCEQSAFVRIVSLSTVLFKIAMGASMMVPYSR